VNNNFHRALGQGTRERRHRHNTTILRERVNKKKLRR
jgi:hypothetical protein